MRCNVGVNPLYLADQHIIAEYHELPMLLGILKYNKWIIKSPIPSVFNLGTGHINFFKNKLRYVQRRHVAVINEMIIRGFKCDTLRIDLTNVSDLFCGDWNPTIEDSLKIRQRIHQKLTNDIHLFSWWRYYRKHLTQEKFNELLERTLNGDLYLV